MAVLNVAGRRWGRGRSLCALAVALLFTFAIAISPAGWLPVLLLPLVLFCPRAAEAEGKDSAPSPGERLVLLHNAGLHLATAESEEDLYRLAVETGIGPLGFDRMSIWLHRPGTELSEGTFGTDEVGQIRDERGQVSIGWTGGLVEELREQRACFAIETECPLRNEAGEEVGTGTRVVASIWEKGAVVGYVGTDNLLRRRPMTEQDGHVLAVYASLISSLRLRLRAESELARTRALLEAAVDECPTGVVIAEAVSGDIIYSNPASLAMCGETRETYPPSLRHERAERWEILRADGSPFAQEDRPLTRAFREGMRTESCPALIRWADGTVRHILANAAPVHGPDGSLVAGVVCFTDVTEHTETSERHRKLERQVQQAQKLESLGVLAGGIAHDFNNLLMAILGNADLARMELPATAPAAPYLSEIEKAAWHAADLCTQMLAYSGKGRLELDNFDLNALVRDMGHLLRVSVAKSSSLRYDLQDGLPTIRGDATQLRQVAMNLITNASEALQGEPGIISITTSTVECGAEYLEEDSLGQDLAPGSYVSLEVSDTGCGMDAEVRSRVFEPFFTTKFTGRGLGMAAVQGIVRGHRGSIRIYSEPGKGTTFKILIPASGAARSAEKTQEDRASAWRGTGCVLLVDDEVSVRSIGGRMLERLGFEVVPAEDGEEALRLFQERQGAVSCILLDLTMPRMDGEETFRQLRQLDPKVRVVLTSGYTEQEATGRFAGKGLAGFIQKPYRLDTLRSTLRGLLEPGHGVA